MVKEKLQGKPSISAAGNLGEYEFVALMAFLMSNVALCIDTILPALPDLGAALKVSQINHLQGVITMVFLGLGIGELLFGTLSDSFGRKPIVATGVGVYVAASMIIVVAPSLEMVLLGRFLQGVGLAAARSVCIAIIRDTYVGDQMARTMSFIMGVFILVPMVAPLIGQLILDAFHWQAIMHFQVIFIGLTMIWFWFRQRETLQKENRLVFSPNIFARGFRTFFQNEGTVLYTLIAGVVQGSFFSYLSASQQIFQGQYLMVEEFPYIFGGLAIAIGISSVLNGSLVLRFGMLRLVQFSLALSVISSLCYVLLFLNAQNPPLWIFLSFLAVQFLVLGFMFGNLAALAMHPLGSIAGIGAAIFSFLSMSLAVVVAYIIGHFIDQTVMPLMMGFLLCNLVGLFLLNLRRSGSARSQVNQ